MKTRTLLVALTTVTFLLLLALTACTRQPLYPPPPITGPEVALDGKTLPPEAPVYFTHRSGGKDITFFVLMVRGTVQSFFDACVTCYPKKMGYRHDGSAVVCRACNQRFSVLTLEKGIGGCYPIKIAGRMRKGMYLIPVATIEAGAKWF